MNFRTREKYILFLILVVSIFFRLWQLNSTPPGLYSDEAINGNDALKTLENKDFKLFYPENTGREALFIWLASISFSIFGPSIWSLRLVSSMVGTLTVLGLYFLSKEMFWNKQQGSAIALLSSFFLAISFWHINFSRIAFRAILTPLILVFSFYFLLKGFRTKKTYNMITAGIIFGLGFYVYSGFRISLVLLAIVLLLYYLLFKKQNSGKRFLKLVFYFLLSVFLIILPLGIYFIKNPDHFIGRTFQIFVFNQLNPIKTFSRSLIFHLGMFNIFGDWNWRHNLPGHPQLFWLIGIFFLFGFFNTIKELKIIPL